MIVKVKKINFSGSIAEKAKDALSIFGKMLDGALEDVPEKMDVWVEANKVVAATEVMKVGDLDPAFKIFFSENMSWDIAEESYDDFMFAWTTNGKFSLNDKTRPLYS